MNTEISIKNLGHFAGYNGSTKSIYQWNTPALAFKDTQRNGKGWYNTKGYSGTKGIEGRTNGFAPLASVWMLVQETLFPAGTSLDMLLNTL